MPLFVCCWLFMSLFQSLCLPGGLGAVEWALPEIGHLWHRWRNLCLDPVRRSLVCGVGQWPWCTGEYEVDHFECSTLITLDALDSSRDVAGAKISGTSRVNQSRLICLDQAHKNNLPRGAKTEGGNTCLSVTFHHVPSVHAVFFKFRWVTSLGPTMALRLSSRTVTASSWWGQSAGSDTGPPRSTWRVKSPVVSGRRMTSR